MLTAEQRRALEWIRDNDHNAARWLLENGKAPRARDDAGKWTQFEIVGPGGSIRIQADVMRSIKDLTEPAPLAQRTRMYQLSEAGRTALVEAHR